MKLYEEIRNYINDANFKLIYANNRLNIVNYHKIIILEEMRIDIICDNKLIKIKGNNLRLLRILEQELLITGHISNIELVDYHE